MHSNNAWDPVHASCNSLAHLWLALQVHLGQVLWGDRVGVQDSSVFTLELNSELLQTRACVRLLPS